MAYGRLGLDEDKFLNASPSYFAKALKGFNDLEFEREKANWERTRLIGYWTLNPYFKKGSNTTPKSFMKLPWDEDIKPMKADEWLKKNEKYNEAWNNLSK